ncbi:hypothetical protein VF21_05711 [Pseudogymnoascus sp. 05NY08]|nr:hypothetical protein VF21_05711 [Pseudogymnoascus sp. 05NY08]
MAALLVGLKIALYTMNRLKAYMDYLQLRDVKESVSLLSNKIDLAKLPLAKGATFDSHQDEHNAACLKNTRVDEQRQIAKWAEDPHSKCIFWLNGMAGTGKSTISRSVAKTCKEKGLLGASFFFNRGESDRGNARRFFTTIATQLAIKVPRLVPSIVKVIDDDPTISDKVLREQFEKLVLQPLSELVYVPRKTLKLIIVIDALDECEREGDMREILRLLARAKDVRPVCLRVFVTSRPELPIRLSFTEILGTRPDLVLHEIPSATTKHDISTYLRHEFAKIRAENLRRNHPYSLSADWPRDENIQALVEMANPLFIFAATVCRFVADLKGNPKKRLKVILDYQTESQTSKLNGTYLPILDQLLVDQDMAEKETLGREFRELVGAIIILADPLSIVSLASLLGIKKEDVNGRLESLHSVLSIPTNEDASVRLLHLSFRDFLLNLPRRGKSPFGVDERETHGILASKCLELLSTPGCLKENMCDIDGPGTLQTEVDTRVIDGRLPAHVQYACRYWVYHLEESKCSIRDGDQVYVFLHEHLLHWLEAISLMGKISESIAILGILQSLASIGESTSLSRFIYDARRFILKNRWIIEMAPLQLYSSAIVFAPKTSIVRSIFKNQIPKWIGRLPKVPLTWSLELQKLEGHSDGVRDVAFSHDGQLLASASSDRTVRLWNPATGAELQKLESHSGEVMSVIFSHDGQLLASASKDQTVRLWNPATGAELQKLKGHSDGVMAVAFSYNSQLLASASDDQTIRLWDPETGAELQKLEGHSREVRAVAFSHDDQLFASALDDRTIRLWNQATGAELIGAVTFSYNSQLLASASDDQTIRLWDPETGAELQELDGHSGEVMSVVFSHDSQLLASTSEDQTIRLWNLVTGAELQKLNGHSGEPLATASNDQTVKIWNLATGAELQNLSGHSNIVKAVTFSHDSQLLASASYDKTVRIWNPATGAELQKLESHSGWVRAVAFSHNGQLLASASDDRTIRLWNPATGAELQKLEGHSSVVTAVAFSHDSQLLASASHDETVRLWNLATGAELQKFQLNILVFTLSFSMDSQCLETNRGRLLLHPSLTSPCPLEPKVTRNIFLNGH